MVANHAMADAGSDGLPALASPGLVAPMLAARIRQRLGIDRRGMNMALAPVSSDDMMGGPQSTYIARSLAFLLLPSSSLPLSLLLSSDVECIIEDSIEDMNTHSVNTEFICMLCQVRVVTFDRFFNSTFSAHG